MLVNSLKLKNFRNYDELSVNFSKGINIFYGDNAQGKTNLIEAIMVAATTKSLRGSKDREMISLSSDESHIRLDIEKNDCFHRIDMHLKKNNPKGVAIDGLKIKKSAELYGLLHVIAFSPEDLSMIKNGPAERRRFMDIELCQLDRVYLSCLTGYNRILVQRNNLLKQISVNPSLKDTMDVWDKQLIYYGCELIKSRKNFIDEISGILKEKHGILSEGEEILDIKYNPDTEESDFENKLKSALQRDIIYKTTTCGPHRDDLSFFINDKNVRNYGSQGQQRSVALSLKLSEIELVKKRINDNPVFLLDDVLSELDRKRQTKLLSEIVNIQTFITCTGLEEFVETRKNYDSIFHVEKGKLIKNSFMEVNDGYRN
ncbi:MAG: DNA replication/repair protein RecF [Clostridiales bacterium]|nr:DNA replication/repair protein RecF [Clostridiales bacterium]